MLRYGTDKPDLRNPLIIHDVSKIFIRDDVRFDIFKNLVKKGNNVRCIVTKQTKAQPRSFFDNIDKWAKTEGSSGMAYFTIEKTQKVTAKGPIGKFFLKDSLIQLMEDTGAKEGDSIFFSCGEKKILKNYCLQQDRKLHMI